MAKQTKHITTDSTWYNDRLYYICYNNGITSSLRSIKENEMKKNKWQLILVITTSICILLYTIVSYGGTRKNIEVYDGGKKTATGKILYEHYMIPDVGECDVAGCVIYETNNGYLIKQHIDLNGDEVCDFIRVWKPLVDPTYGTYYTIYTNRPCHTLDELKGK